MGLFGLFKRNKPADEFEEYRRSGADDETRSSSGKPLFVIDDVFSIAGKGVVVTGTVESGEFIAGDAVIACDLPAKIVAIEMFRKTVAALCEGESGGLLLSGIKAADISRGGEITKDE